MSCSNQNNKEWRDSNPEAVLWRNAKTRAKVRNLDFDIDYDDIQIPEFCPYLKVPLVRGTLYAPSIDRIDNSKGYIKGNIEVISRQANAMKNSASTAELLEFAYTILERY
jgi:hypothetical protein